MLLTNLMEMPFMMTRRKMTGLVLATTAAALFSTANIAISR